MTTYTLTTPQPPYYQEARDGRIVATAYEVHPYPGEPETRSRAYIPVGDPELPDGRELATVKLAGHGRHPEAFSCVFALAAAELAA